MFDNITLLIVFLFVPYGTSTPIKRNQNLDSDYNSITQRDHNVQRRSFGSIELDNGFANLLDTGSVIPVSSSFLPRISAFHSFLPYPYPNIPGPIPGSYPAPFGQTYQHSPGHTHYDGHQHQGCNGYSCKPGYNHQYVGYDYHHHGHDKGHHDHRYHVCDHPGHTNMGPHEHHNGDDGRQPITEKTITTASTEVKAQTTDTTTVRATTTSRSHQGPTYDIDIRFGKN